MQTDRSHRASLPTPLPTIYDTGNNKIDDKTPSSGQGPRVTYIVKDGDTIAGIALRHGMRESDLRKLNHLFGGQIYKGQELVVRLKVRSNSVPTTSTYEPVPISAPVVRRQSQVKVIETATDALSSNAFTPSNQQDDGSSPATSPLASDSDLTPKCSIKVLGMQPEAEPSLKKPLVDVTSIPKLFNATAMDILPDPNYSKFLVPKLEACLPPQYRGYDWSIAYSLAQHGASLDTLHRRVRHKRPTLIVVETSDGDIFGAFTATPWVVSHSFYGSGECFVFTCHPKFESFTWKGKDSMFMFSNESVLAMGGGGGFAWGLNADLSRGTSARSLTFENRCLTKRSEFEVVNCEVWEFVPKV
ncbi:unnamed protein product [Aphanomyces euteiches]|uniref:Oxidation resistance protein 1 n=1 Tax=Aphanomyces euteiches TaxID=100861 RepID=A0A6G0XBK8_9STRA|nr:hypothetical protein Ae201684_006568 [Aphanomyces euteiches]KAH9091160.1 hypothetical protein Ae201684P_006560 [Aphanomyces euteiches]KAH9139971.1 hypothetical protein AeRB84_015746 [Aphanomyces euteiches]